jgi:glyoxylase-like metal-dependent hydrolase (beta-lactamase superfamily II)
MHRWRVGDIDIVRIEDESFALPSDEPAPGWAVPDFAPSSAEVGIAFSALALADGDRRILVDPWLANDGPRARADAAEHVERLLAELDRAGFPAEAIDTVVNSHFDGSGWNTRPDHGPSSATDEARWVPTFANARYLYPRAEIDAWRAGQFPLLAEAFGELAAAGVLDAVDPPLALTPGIRLEDAPGHARGHVSVRIESGGDLAIIGGHLFLSPFQIDDPSVAADIDPDTATLTRRRLLEGLADQGGLLLTTLLGGPGGGRVHPHGRTEGSFRLDA